MVQGRAFGNNPGEGEGRCPVCWGVKRAFSCSPPIGPLQNHFSKRGVIEKNHKKITPGKNHQYGKKKKRSSTLFPPPGVSLGGRGFHRLVSGLEKNPGGTISRRKKITKHGKRTQRHPTRACPWAQAACRLRFSVAAPSWYLAFSSGVRAGLSPGPCDQRGKKKVWQKLEANEEEKGGIPQCACKGFHNGIFC